MENTTMPTLEAATPEAAPKKDGSQIGKYTVVDLDELDLRTVWKNEAQHFTKWLSEPENLNRLGDVLGLSFDPNTIKRENKNGQSNRRCDIVAHLQKEDDDDDEERGEIVAIENQLEATDFSHLGRLILYAALEKATRIVWVVGRATYECRKAIAWLNENTTDSLRFYLIEVIVYDMEARGEKSVGMNKNRVAPIFRLIEGPDEVEKVEKSGTPKRRANLAFWKGFLAYKDEPKNHGKLDSITSFRSPLPENWFGIAIGSSKCHINLEYSNEQVKIVVVTEGQDNDIFKSLKTKQGEMEKAIGGDCKTVTSNENAKQPLFRFFGPKCDVQQENDISKAYNWLINGLSKIVPIVKATLNLR